jgi:hypothetical protein
LKELRNRKQVEMQVWNQSNILQDRTLIDPNGPTRKHLTFAIVPMWCTPYIARGRGWRTILNFRSCGTNNRNQ